MSIRERLCLAGVCALLLAVGAVAQTTVTTSGGTTNAIPVFTGSSTVGNSPITVSGGNVGIGTASPDRELKIHPDSDNQAGIFSITNFGNTAEIFIAGDDPSGNGSVNVRNSSNTSQVSLNSNGSSYINGGNLGVGQASPKSLLEIYGTSDQDTAALTDAGSRQSNLALNAGDDGLGAGASISFGNAQSNIAGTIGWAAIKGFLTNGSGNTYGDLAFSTRNSTSDTALTERMRILGSGNVGVGTTTPGARLEVNGNIKLTSGSGASVTFSDGTVQSTAWTGSLCGGDYAESVDVSGDRTRYEPGDVLVIDTEQPGKFLKSIEPYSTTVTGIYSTKPGVIGRRKTTSATEAKLEVPMAMIGIVPVKVSAENGPIKPGDFLVTSSIPGRAMKGTDRSRMFGAVVGKALGTLSTGTGVIEAVVSLQ